MSHSLSTSGFKNEKILMEISENEIGFKYLENAVMTSRIKLKNISNSMISFKIKATNPKTFMVKPNKGCLNPNEEIDIEFNMQAMTMNEKLISKTMTINEKFLFSGMEVAPNFNVIFKIIPHFIFKINQLDELWKTKLLQEPNEIQNIKAKVIIYTDEEAKKSINSSPNHEPKSRISEIGSYSSPRNDNKLIGSVNQTAEMLKKYDETCHKLADMKEKINSIKKERDEYFFKVMETKKQFPPSTKKNNKKIIIIVALIIIAMLYKFML